MGKFKGWLEAVLGWLQTNHAVKLQIRVYLSAARCYESVRKAWLTNYLSFYMSGIRPKTITEHGKRYMIEGDDGKKVEASSSKLVMPRLWQSSRLYHIISTSTLVYAVLTTSLPIQQWWDRYTGFHHIIKGKCLFMGQFILLVQQNDYAAILFSLYHLLWRLVQSESFRLLDLNMVQFLYQESELVKAEQRQLELNKRRGGWWAPRNKQPKPDELYLRSLMGYRIKWSNVLATYRLRSNRTSEAKRELERQLARITLISSSSFLVLFLIFLTVIMLCQFTDGAYAARYPQCSPQLEQMMADGSASWWTVTPTLHRCLSFVIDMWVNFFIWVDSGIALTLVVGLAYMVNYDLVHYWTQIHKRLVRLKYRLQCQRPVEDELIALENSLWINGQNHRDRVEHMNEFKESLERIESTMEETDREVYEVQSEINDFFKQLGKADCYVSDIISATVVIWLGSFVIACFVYGTLYNKTEVRLIQFIGLVVITAENVILLELSIKVKQSYGLICSIMALDHSIHKEKFIGILDLYARQSSGTHYTLARVWTYRSSTFLSLIGWTFSLAALSDSIMKRLT